MNHSTLLFLDATKPSAIILIAVILCIPLAVAYLLGYYRGKDVARKEMEKKN